MSKNGISPYQSTTPFTHGPLGVVFAKTALPIIFVMGMNGMLAVVDAIFLGLFVGAGAVGAVTLIFPIYMVLTALATLIASGMSSLMARHLGAGRKAAAGATFAGAHGLALLIATIVILLFSGFGDGLVRQLAQGNPDLAAMAYRYLAVLSFGSPVFFLLSVQSDALRNEGLAPLMAVLGLFVTLANVALNYLLIVTFAMGVTGSALGTVAAQALALLIVIGLRLSGRTPLSMAVIFDYGLMRKWRQILVLGIPQCLGILGIAVGAGAVIGALQWLAIPDYANVVAAYGVVTRLTGFVFLPVLGLSQAMQSIVGHNYGARLWRRSDHGVKIGLIAALIYCGVTQLVLMTCARPLGVMFVDDPRVIDEVARILPVLSASFVLVGPLMMVATYFQAIGDAGRAAMLSLAKPYLFAVPLTFALPSLWGEGGIWLARPGADILLCVLTLLILVVRWRRGAFAWGLFAAPERD
jgi:putative MATE family efflux protein